MPEPKDNDIRRDPRFVELRTDFLDAFEALTRESVDDGLEQDAAIDEVSGRFKKLIECAMGKVFDDDGYIPPAETCTEAEVCRWFVFSDHRQALLDRVRSWVGLAVAVGAKRFLLDGSFVTGKNEPGDVDAVVLLPEDFHDQVQAGSAGALELVEVLVTGEPKELFAAEDEADWWRWFEFFGRTRRANGRRKGLIEVAL